MPIAIGIRLIILYKICARKLLLSAEMIACLKQDHEALKLFKSLPPSHKQYYSKWIESAKTAVSKTKRIVISLEGLSKKQGYGEMMRQYRKGIE